MKILVALTLGVAMLLPSAAAYAGERGSDQDRGTFVESAVIQTEPVQLGTLSGPEVAPSIPYLNLREENYGH